jgi:hypothetical protein
MSLCVSGYLLCNQRVRESDLVRDQEAGGSNPLAPTISSQFKPKSEHHPDVSQSKSHFGASVASLRERTGLSHLYHWSDLNVSQDAPLDGYVVVLQDIVWEGSFSALRSSRSAGSASRKTNSRKLMMAPSESIARYR